MAHKNPIGSVSEHDICLKTMNDGLNPQRLTAGRVMNGKIVTVSGDATLEDCARLMQRHQTDRLFVIDENGAYDGILTDKNLVFEDSESNVNNVLNGIRISTLQGQELHLAY
jgi:CBS domain-containing protein